MTPTVYRCPECGRDVTAAVEKALGEERLAVHLIIGYDRRKPVTVMCPEGHWAQYAPLEAGR